MIFSDCAETKLGRVRQNRASKHKQDGPERERDREGKRMKDSQDYSISYVRYVGVTERDETRR